LVTGLEVLDDLLAAARVVHHHEAPGLAQSNRRAAASDADVPFQRSVGQRIGTKAAHIPPPTEELQQASAESLIELWWGRRMIHTRLAATGVWTLLAEMARNS